MNVPVLLVALLAGASTLASPAAPDATPEAAAQLGNFEIQMAYDSDDPEGPTRARIRIQAIDKSTPLPRSIQVHMAGERRAQTIRLRMDDDGAAVARGMLPPPDRVQALSLNFEEIKVTFKTGALTEGETEPMIEMETPSAKKRGKGPKVKVRVRCCPVQVIVVVGVIDQGSLEEF